MVYKVIISEEAISDLRSVVSYISIDNPAVAKDFGLKLILSTKPLAHHPRIGRIVPEFKDERIRELIFGSYRIPYRIKKDFHLIEVLRFWHSAQKELNI